MTGELTSSFRTRLHEVYYQEKENRVSRINLSAELDWEIIPGLHLKPMFSYTNNEGKEKIIKVDEGQTSTVIPDAVLKTSFKLISTFKPADDAFDDIPTLEKIMDFPAYYTISKEDWDAVHEQYVDADRTDWGISASTEEKVGENAGKYGIATCILDGDLASFWHSQWKGEGANPPLPHEIIIDM